VAGFVLLLLLGTQVLDWYWIALLAGGTLLGGTYRVWRRTPSLYKLAQVLDTRLGLHDTLSTAFYYGSQARTRSEQTREAQLEQALALAPGLDLKHALPAPRPRSLYAVGGLSVIALGLFAVRYGVTQSLDLRPSLVRIALDRLLPEEPAANASRKTPLKKRLSDQLEKLGIQIGDEAGDRLEGGTDGTMTPAEGQQASAESKQGPTSQKSAIDPNNPEEQGDAQAQSERGAASGDQKSGDEQGKPGDQASGGEQSQQQDAQNKGNQAGAQNPSMMDRMRDAMASLMNKLRSQQNGSQSQQASSKESQNGQGSKSQGQKGSPMPGKPQGEGQGQGDPNGEQQGQGDKSQMAQGKAGEKSGQSPPSSDPKSGAGREDGDKSAREAEQLAAMGKISEIIGKRSQNLTGEILVEVQSNKQQQLKTAYSGKQAAHAEAGGEISRDEVPLMYQQYVRQYFAQVRKPAPAARTTAKPVGAGN